MSDKERDKRITLGNDSTIEYNWKGLDDDRLDNDIFDSETLKLLSSSFTPNRNRSFEIFGEPPVRAWPRMMELLDETQKNMDENTWTGPVEEVECPECRRKFPGGDGVDGDGGEQFCSIDCLNDHYI